GCRGGRRAGRPARRRRARLPDPGRLRRPRRPEARIRRATGADGAAGTVFALTGSLPALILATLTGTVSTDVVESGPFTSLEQAMLPHATDRDPTAVFGAYNTIATIAGALGALAAGGPTLLHTGSARWL